VKHYIKIVDIIGLFILSGNCESCRWRDELSLSTQRYHFIPSFLVLCHI